MRGQGATEYLVLLAIVLVVALVAIALLGFFPGTSSDARRTESDTYWRSASPVAVVDTAAKDVSGYSGHPEWNGAYLRLRNTGSHPIRITGLIAAGNTATLFADASAISIDIQPGEENCIGMTGIGCESHAVYLLKKNESGSGATLAGASTICTTTNSGVTSSGFLTLEQLGFTYQVQIGSAVVTKRQVGKDLIIPCR